MLSYRLNLFRLLKQNTIDWGAYTTNIFLRVLEAGESKIRMLADLVCGEAHFLTCSWLSPG